MRKLLFLLLAASTWSACTKTELTPTSSVQSSEETDATTTNKSITLTKGSDSGLYLNGDNFSYSPGDTLVLTGSWSYCTLENVYGTSSKNIVIINKGGKVKMTSGFSFTNCRYIQVLGNGASGVYYGFSIAATTNSGVGVTIQGRSSDIEVARVDIYNKTYGYWVKEEASCIDSLEYPNWVINNIQIRRGRIRVCNQEGMYLGSTDPNGTRAITCSGETIYPKPLRLGFIRVHHMKIDSTYRSGIQLSAASGQTSQIHDNTVTNCGYEYNSDGQGCGISLGGYTTAKVYNNTIKNTYTMGISSLGAGQIIIQNNKVTNSGTLSGHTVSGMANIMVDTRYTSPVDSTTFNVSGNTLSGTTDYNIRVYKTYSTYTKKNIIYNNNSGNATKSVASGVTWSTQ
ncbi:right-handed parallel beta-helix repeat-containing protein [Parafilimonas sp.]|uniref:right-handed parallel beta-helix repeat-containing protein n=1 Tax=Parafilimonas sp. TaxID=1969739 RepID=UPI0039E33257